MKIGIIGAGFTGLSAAFELSSRHHQVTVFESDSLPGGLGVGFINPKWAWPLEKHYHHLFTSDNHILNLAKKVSHQINFYSPITSSYTLQGIFQTDSPLSLLRFTPLSFMNRVRTGIGLASLKFNPFWQPLESLTAKQYIQNIFGQASWSHLWEPLLVGKFGSFADKISASWFWARIYKRSPSLGYPEGGFLTFAKKIESVASELGVKFLYSTSVVSLTHPQGKLIIHTAQEEKFEFDRVISTLPVALTAKISGLTYPDFPSLGAVTLVVSLSQSFLPNHIYWLNICDRSFPFLSVVEHTHLITSSHYHQEHLLYIGNYLPADHPYFHRTSQELIREFTPFLKQINPNFRLSWVNDSWVWKAPFAQPIVTINYSRRIPTLVTPIPNLFMANMQQVYPWDRGTNYAVELGIKAANLCVTDSPP